MAWPTTAADQAETHMPQVSSSLLSHPLLLGLLCLVVGCGPKTVKQQLADLKQQDPSLEFPIEEFPVGIHHVPPAHGVDAMKMYTASGTVILPSPMPEFLLEKPPASPYAGAAACRHCHAEIYETTLKTAHWNTTRPATRETVLGSFEPPENTLRTVVEDFGFTMELREGRLWQTLILQYGPRFTHSVPMDIAVGSGNSGQSFLSWTGPSLIQLPVSYMTTPDCWVNSPGYKDGTASFARPVTARCLECHTTYAYPYSGYINLYDRESIQLGITCEKCHGPGKSHISFHAEQTLHKEDPIYNPGADSPARSIDVCRLCHSGAGAALSPALSFRPGRILETHYRVDMTHAEAGVHTANQYQRLSLSSCFQNSDDMTCTTCHDPHSNEHRQVELFSRRCHQCHAPDHCSTARLQGESAFTRCVECHMPLQNDESISTTRESQQFSPLMRDHFIRVPGEETLGND